MKSIIIIIIIALFSSCSTVNHHLEYSDILQKGKIPTSNDDRVVMYKKFCSYKKSNLEKKIFKDYFIDKMKTNTDKINKALSVTDKIIYDALRSHYIDEFSSKFTAEEIKQNQDIRSEMQVRLLEKLDNLKIKAISEDDLGYPVIFKKTGLNVSIFPADKNVGRVMAICQKEGGLFKDIRSISVLLTNKETKFEVYINTDSDRMTIKDYLNERFENSREYCTPKKKKK